MTPSAPTTDTAPETAALGTPDYHWEGPFDITRGDVDDSFILRAMIGFHGDLVEGSGDIHLANSEAMGEVSLTGDRNGGALRFSLWFTDVEARAPVECSGELSLDEQRITGDWSFECLDPENCGCGGGAGTFTLDRVRD